MTSGPGLTEEVTAIIKHSVSNVLPTVFRSTNEVLLVLFCFFHLLTGDFQQLSPRASHLR